MSKSVPTNLATPSGHTTYCPFFRTMGDGAVGRESGPRVVSLCAAARVGHGSGGARGKQVAGVVQGRKGGSRGRANANAKAEVVGREILAGVASVKIAAGGFPASAVSPSGVGANYISPNAIASYSGVMDLLEDANRREYHQSPRVFRRAGSASRGTGTSGVGSGSRLSSSGREAALSSNGGLLENVASGDPSAVRACIDRFGGLVWSLARRLTSSDAEAEDAVQEIFIELWKHAGRYDANVASETAFVAMIARRRLIDRRRKRDRQLDKTPLGDFDVGSPVRAESSAATGDEVGKASRAFEQLSEDQRRVLSLSIYHGLSHEKISRSLDMPLGTVKTHARRGLIRIREMLGVKAPLIADGTDLGDHGRGDHDRGDNGGGRAGTREEEATS